jgi:hypothetical protein
MKNIFLILTVFFLPTVIVFNETNNFNVFNVNGKLFLQYYSVLICCCIVLLCVLKKSKLDIVISSTVLLIGGIKIIVGISRDKPVGFLLLLILFYMAVQVVIKKNK